MIRFGLTLLILAVLSGCKHGGGSHEHDGGSQVIHATVPRQKVIVDIPEDCEIPESTTTRRTVRQSAQTQSAPAPAVVQSAPAPIFQQSQPMMGMVQSSPVLQAANPSGFVAVNTTQATPLTTTQQTVKNPRNRLALGLTTIRIPIPFIQFLSVPVPGEITTTSTIPAPQQQQILQVQQQQQFVPVQQQSFVPVQQPFAPQVIQQTQFAQPQFAPQFAPQIIQQQPQFAPQVIQQQQPQAQIVIQPQAAPRSAPAPQAFPADCPPVKKETLDDLEKEIKRSRELNPGK